MEEIENIYNCPQKIWAKLKDKQQLYNNYMDLLDFDEWCTLNDEIIKDRNILAHNALVSILL